MKTRKHWLKYAWLFNKLEYILGCNCWCIKTPISILASKCIKLSCKIHLISNLSNHAEMPKKLLTCSPTAIISILSFSEFHTVLSQNSHQIMNFPFQSEPNHCAWYSLEWSSAWLGNTSRVEIKLGQRGTVSWLPA